MAVDGFNTIRFQPQFHPPGQGALLLYETTLLVSAFITTHPLVQARLLSIMTALCSYQALLELSAVALEWASTTRSPSP